MALRWIVILGNFTFHSSSIVILLLLISYPHWNISRFSSNQCLIPTQPFNYVCVKIFVADWVFPSKQACISFHPDSSIQQVVPSSTLTLLGSFTRSEVPVWGRKARMAKGTAVPYQCNPRDMLGEIGEAQRVLVGSTCSLIKAIIIITVTYWWVDRR